MAKGKSSQQLILSGSKKASSSISWRIWAWERTCLGNLGIWPASLLDIPLSAHQEFIARVLNASFVFDKDC